MYSELLQEFHGLPVVEFNGPDDWKDLQTAYRIREDYEDDLKVTDRIAALLAQPDCKHLSALIIGSWSGAFEGGGSEEAANELVKVSMQLPGLRHLFFGEMTYEECEISWINQSDLSPLLNAFPKLASLRVRGGTGLSFSQTRHKGLKELAIETGGLSKSTMRDIFLCDFPNLEHLELLLGEENYGFDGGVEDLQPLLSGRIFPCLKMLGLKNSSISNDIAAVLVNSPIVERIESIDLSMGSLNDEGVNSLMELAAHRHLKLLNISHHYASTDSIENLKRILPFEVISEDAQVKDDDDDWRPILHAE